MNVTIRFIQKKIKKKLFINYKKVSLGDQKIFSIKYINSN